MNNKTRKIHLFFLIFVCLFLNHFVFYRIAVAEQYNITVTARTGGKVIAPDGSEVAGPSTKIFGFNENSNAEFKFEPDPSWSLSDVVLDSISLGPLNKGSYTFTSIKSNHEIIVVFSDASIIIPESAGDDLMFSFEGPLSQEFKDKIAKGLSYTSPVVSVDSVNGTQNGDAIYMTFFRPVDDGRWQGNLKKYGLEYLERPECPGREYPEWTIVDKNGDIAVDCAGAFLENSVSYWSDTADGGILNKGGAGQVLLDVLMDISPLTAVSQFHSVRNIKTYIGSTTGSFVNFNGENITKDFLKVEDDATLNRIINYIYGYTYDADSDGRPVEKRNWVLGDIVHSEPEIIEYFDPSTGDLQHRFIAVGSNDGMLHVFTDTTIFFDKKTYSPGEEIFAFIPTDLLPKLKEMAVSSTRHIHMVDGSPKLFRPGTTDFVSGYLNKTLVFGERRGGQSYWALDLTKPDPSTWTVKWHIAGNTENLETPLTKKINELGFTWNKPNFAELKISESEDKHIMIFAGGYDPAEDGFPEGFIDSNQNGEWDTGEAHAATAGGTEGYDRYNPAINK
ncbi:MAG: hypothetical protein JXL81_04875, partial [Deltaproteobacteria bacterium]|nr:hypothetical protein [Deltaproteobacteria bacterium]